MIPEPAQYLLRFDDLCPTMDRHRWQMFLPLIEEFGIKPILAVVPDNRDPALAVVEPDPEFWGEMRRMQACGATIGLHGYRHLPASKGSGLLPLHRMTEFAGVAAETQREWIHAGLEILRARGLNPTIWIAPRHGFDGNTLAALREEGIALLSDGFARAPFSWRGLTWIPQQLWEPVDKPSGLWTICLHGNSASGQLVKRLEDFLRRYAGQFTSVGRVLSELPVEELSFSGRILQTAAPLGLRGKRKLKGLFRAA